jgi:hypothetical protein
LVYLIDPGERPSVRNTTGLLRFRKYLSFVFMVLF